jgi:hypothetical protein
MHLFAGMPSVSLTDVAKLRLENISFFLVGFFVCAFLIKLLWNYLASDPPSIGLSTSPDGFGGRRKEYTLIALADGTVRHVRNDISPEVLKALATPRGGERFEAADLD